MSLRICDLGIMELFPVIEIPDNAPDTQEAVGSKPKFWFYREGDRRPWLYKERRPGTGEDWAEKIAAELCGLLGLPHAHYELARYVDKTGVVTQRLTDENERLVLGNELLADHHQDYPRAENERFRRIRQHTLTRVFEVLQGPFAIGVPPEELLPVAVNTAAELFVGYLLLDALIGNTDRHDKNWGVIERQLETGVKRYLAPTFDHASSLGRELTDLERQKRLTTRDQGYSVAAYCSKAVSELFKQEQDQRPLGCLGAFRAAAEQHPEAARFWLSRLEDLNGDLLATLLHHLPSDRISEEGTRFAAHVVNFNRAQLLTLRT
jgi:hypothetical protein